MNKGKNISSVTIPGYAEPALGNERLGTILFVASEIMLFAGLVAAYVVLHYGSNGFAGMEAPQQTGTEWLMGLLLLGVWGATLVVRRLDRSGKENSTGILGVVSILLVAVYLVLELSGGTGSVPYSEEHGINVYQGMYWLLGAVHAAHVLVGVVLLIPYTVYAFGNSKRKRTTGYNAVLPLYWGFLAIMWLILHLILR